MHLKLKKKLLNYDSAVTARNGVILYTEWFNKKYPHCFSLLFETGKNMLEQVEFAFEIDISDSPFNY